MKFDSIFSGKDDHFGSLPLHYTVTVFSNGSVWAESTLTTFSTWCLNLERNWPYEAVSCSIQIQLDHFTSAKLIPLNKTFFILPRVCVLNFRLVKIFKKKTQAKEIAKIFAHKISFIS